MLLSECSRYLIVSLAAVLVLGIAAGCGAKKKASKNK